MINLYSQARCPFSDAARAYLKSHNIPFIEYDFSSSSYKTFANLFGYSKRPLIVVYFSNRKVSYLNGHSELSKFNLNPSSYESFLQTFLKDRLYDHPATPT